jgi:DNA-binding transcriptional regulator GbsR (MarR family)
MANKMTQKDYFNEIIALAKENGRDDLVTFCEDRIEKLSKKSASKKPTKTQIANEDIKATLVTILTELDNPSTVSEIMTDSRLESGLSNQKVSSLLKQLRDDGTVVRIEEKGKAYYAIA